MLGLRSRGRCAIALALVAATCLGGCGPRVRESGSGAIKMTGSDTMIQLSNAWKEAFEATHSDVFMEVKGGGSGVGIAALCSGKIDIATSSRQMKTKEVDLAKTNTGKEPKEYVVGRDALAIYVHKENPLASISISQLAEIYGREGKIKTWKDLNVDNTACSGGQIILISRQNSSGTYAYFKEAVLGEATEYRQGMISQSGSSEVVSLVSKTPCAIGYSGMGYFRPELVKLVKVAKQEGEPAIMPTVETALDGTYPISRPLYLYTLGEPTGSVLEFIQWVQSAEGQKIVEQEGYVPARSESKPQ